MTSATRPVDEIANRFRRDNRFCTAREEGKQTRELRLRRVVDIEPRIHIDRDNRKTLVVKAELRAHRGARLERIQIGGSLFTIENRGKAVAHLRCRQHDSALRRVSTNQTRTKIRCDTCAVLS